ncbi:MAG: SBBP repeat-containing protein, partial [Pseudonocardiaceae bacterium]
MSCEAHAGFCERREVRSLPATHLFVSQLNSSGSALVYSTYLGAPGGDQSGGIAVDSAGRAYVTYAVAPGFPVLDPLPTSDCNSAAPEPFSPFLSRLNPDGSALNFSTCVPGGGTRLDVDSSGNSYIFGATNVGGFPNLNAFQDGIA